MLGDRLNEVMLPKIKEVQARLTTEDYEEARKRGDYSPDWTEALQYVFTKFDEEKILNQERQFFKDFDTLYKGNLVLGAFANADPSLKERLKVLADGHKNINVFDALPNLAVKDGLLPDGHPNPKGHLIIAENLYDYLFKKGLMIPCH